MSKDFKPVELYLSDKKFEKMGKSLRNMQVEWTVGEEKIPSVQPPAEAVEAYPELSFLFGKFNELYSKYRYSTVAREVFTEAEKALKKAEDEISDSELLNRSTPYAHHLALCDFETKAKFTLGIVAREWFYGRLDENFYLGEINDERFFDFLDSKIRYNLLLDGCHLKTQPE